MALMALGFETGMLALVCFLHVIYKEACPFKQLF